MNRQPRYVIKDREQSPLAESFRALCSCIQDEAALGKIQTVLFASASADEGGTMAAVNRHATATGAARRAITTPRVPVKTTLCWFLFTTSISSRF